jgi:hypothetical protein
LIGLDGRSGQIETDARIKDGKQLAAEIEQARDAWGSLCQRREGGHRDDALDRRRRESKAPPADAARQYGDGPGSGRQGTLMNGI